MKWILIAVAYTVTADDVSHELRFHELAFETETLCEAARGRMEEQLQTRAITVKTTCVQTSE